MAFGAQGKENIQKELWYQVAYEAHVGTIKGGPRRQGRET